MTPDAEKIPRSSNAKVIFWMTPQHRTIDHAGTPTNKDLIILTVGRQIFILWFIWIISLVVGVRGKVCRRITRSIRRPAERYGRIQPSQSAPAILHAALPCLWLFPPSLSPTHLNSTMVGYQVLMIVRVSEELIMAHNIVDHNDNDTCHLKHTSNVVKGNDEEYPQSPSLPKSKEGKGRWSYSRCPWGKAQGRSQLPRLCSSLTIWNQCRWSGSGREAQAQGPSRWSDGPFPYQTACYAVKSGREWFVTHYLLVSYNCLRYKEIIMMHILANYSHHLLGLLFNQETSWTMLCYSQAKGIRKWSHAGIFPPIEAYFISASIKSVWILPHHHWPRSGGILSWVFLAT